MTETPPHLRPAPKSFSIEDDADEGRGIHRITDPARVALLVVDMQNGFVAPDQALACPSAISIVPAILALAKAVREMGGTVVWTRHTASPDPDKATPPWFDVVMGEAMSVNLKALRSGAVAHAIFGAFDIGPDDIVVDKYRASAFLPDRADLHRKLQLRSIDTVIVVGVVTNYCCQSTARDAAMLDYRVFMVPDATACFSDQIQSLTFADLSAMGFFDLRSHRQVISELEHAAQQNRWDRSR